MLKSKLEKAGAKADDKEQYSRRNNIRILGLLKPTERIVTM